MGNIICGANTLIGSELLHGKNNHKIKQKHFLFTLKCLMYEWINTVINIAALPKEITKYYKKFKTSWLREWFPQIITNQKEWNSFTKNNLCNENDIIVYLMDHRKTLTQHRNIVQE